MQKLVPCFFFLLFCLIYPSTTFAHSSLDDVITWTDDVRFSQQEVGLFQGHATLYPLDESTARIVWHDPSSKRSLRKQIESSPFIDSIEPDYERVAHIVNDEYYKQQWALQEMNLEASWFSSYQKRSAIIAVIDSGADLQHEDLQKTFTQEAINFVSPGQPVRDENGHGTSIAGLIAAETDNKKGIAGATHTYPIKVLPLQVMDANGRTKVSYIVQAIQAAIDRKVDVINLSFGASKPSTAEEKAITKAREAGIIVVASAGNDALRGNPINYPAAYEGVIAVGATTPDRTRAPFSNWHPYVTVSAPGTQLWTTAPNNQYHSVQGTSFAAPLVSATIAMMKSIQPTLTERDILREIERSSIDLGTPGRDPEFGYGLLDTKQIIDRVANETYDERLIIASPIIDLQERRQISEQWTDSDGNIHLLMRNGESKWVRTRPFTTWSHSPAVTTLPTLDGTLLVAQSYGLATLTARSPSTVKTYIVHVTNSPTDAVTFAHTTLEGPLQWKSSDPQIASIDGFGLITAYRPGITNIVVTNGEQTIQQSLKVVGKASPLLQQKKYKQLPEKHAKEAITITWNEPVSPNVSIESFLQITSDETNYNTVPIHTRWISPRVLEIRPQTTWTHSQLYGDIQPFRSQFGHLLEEPMHFQFSSH